MSEYASAVERARRAFASLSKLEGALARAPERRDLQTNLAASHKLARQAQEQLLRLSELQHVEVCNYRLMPESTISYGIPHVSRSLLEYQNLFSQVHDALRNGPKERAVIGAEAMKESNLEFAYSYSGSLGIVLFVESERLFFDGKLDNSIDALFQVLEIESQNTVRDVANTLGKAVVKRARDWSEVNIEGGFATDVRWNRSDGRQLGEVIERRRMERIVNAIDATSDEKIQEVDVVAMLVAGNIRSGTFHLSVPNGPDFRGHQAREFFSAIPMTLGQMYRARIREKKTIVYSTDEVAVKYELLALEESPFPKDVPSPP